MNENIIGERIAEIRRQRNMSQEMLAEHLNIGRSSVIRYETGQTTPSCHIIIKLCTLFSVSADYLLGLTDSDPAAVHVNIQKARSFKNTDDTAKNYTLTHSLKEEIRQYIDQAIEIALERKNKK